MKTIETRKSEIRTTTSNAYEMLGKFLGKDLLRTWKENFVDEDSGEIVEVDRSEIIGKAGQLIEGDLLSRINFHIAAGEVTEVEVSNQRREAVCLRNTHFTPYQAAFEVKDKKKKYLLYAPSVEVALEIVKDYVELNFSGWYTIRMIKEFNSCILLHDQLSPLAIDADPDAGPAEEVSEADKKYYQIEVNVLNDDFNTFETFVLFSKDVDSAMILINDYVAKVINERVKNSKHPMSSDFKITLESATVLPFSGMIEREFSEEYQEKQ